MSRCDSRQFAEWQAYYQLEPWGEERADLRAGIIASTIANVNRGKGQRAFTPSDFMPEFNPKPKQRMSAEQMAAVMTKFTRLHNAREARKRTSA